MKKDDNSGVSIKQIIITALFLVVTTFGGLNTYRIVCENNANTIQNLESACLNDNVYEAALVENTEDDIVYSENIKYLAAKIVELESTCSGDDLELANGNIINNTEKIISRGNFVREQIADDITSDNNKLLGTVLSGIKDIGENQDNIINVINSDLKENIKKSNLSEKSGNTSVSKEISGDAVALEEKFSDINKEIEVESTVTDASAVSTEVVEEIVPVGAPTEYVKTIDVKATAYCLCKKCCGKSPSNPAYGVTASGLKIIPGNNMKVVASDPSVIPLGTNVYIEGLYGAKDYGYAIVADTGSAIKNLKIDLYMDTHQMALNWGVKTVRVYILDK